MSIFDYEKYVQICLKVLLIMSARVCFLVCTVICPIQVVIKFLLVLLEDKSECNWAHIVRKSIYQFI